MDAYKTQIIMLSFTVNTGKQNPISAGDENVFKKMELL